MARPFASVPRQLWLQWLDFAEHGAGECRRGAATAIDPVNPFTARSTFFSQGPSTFGCGIPRNRLTDENGRALPYVALNLLRGNPGFEPTRPIPQEFRGIFNDGATCGRWIEITVLENCIGGSNAASPQTIDDICIGGCVLFPCASPVAQLLSLLCCPGQACCSNGVIRSLHCTNLPPSGMRAALGFEGANDFAPPSQTCPTVIDGYVATFCPDDNYWCRQDDDHLDISVEYLREIGALDGPQNRQWNGRQVRWRFMTGPPDGCAAYVLLCPCALFSDLLLH